MHIRIVNDRTTQHAPKYDLLLSYFVDRLHLIVRALERLFVTRPHLIVKFVSSFLT
jgi:hypothetical protein